MDIMGQFRANSHHVQGIEVTNEHCYTCHWESDEHGLINREHHQGYNNKEFSGEPNREVDLVIWDSTTRPTEYEINQTAIQFTASNMLISPADERQEVNKITDHCLGCHSDMNNDTEPFGDCKTPRQYAWDGSSVDPRYSQSGSTTWGKYTTMGSKKDQVKAAEEAAKEQARLTEELYDSLPKHSEKYYNYKVDQLGKEKEAALATYADIATGKTASEEQIMMIEQNLYS